MVNFVLKKWLWISSPKIPLLKGFIKVLKFDFKFVFYFSIFFCPFFLFNSIFSHFFSSPSDIIKYQENVASSPPLCDLNRVEDDDDDDDTCEEPKFTAGRKNVIFFKPESYKEKL